MASSSIPSLTTLAFGDTYRGKRVLMTGHTGFKDSWLCERLLTLGAEVSGITLEPPTSPALFNQLQLSNRLQHNLIDIRDEERVADAIRKFQPQFLFHLAAQPLVRLSYEKAVENYEINVMGTIHVLEALRRQSSQPCAAVFITTDKCYENREWIYAYREVDLLGGHDPYSSSKAAAEIAISAYRRSFFPPDHHAIKVASARAGNVIGGGDWALDRIVPDSMRALSRGESIPVRNKTSTRPWQHVLEPLSGYLWLGAVLQAPLLVERSSATEFCAAFNFGPSLSSNRTVRDLVEEILKNRSGNWVDRSNPDAVHEASLLNLSTDKAHHLLRWQPVWSFKETVAHTVQWYDAVEKDSATIGDLTYNQINSYTRDANRQGIAWAGPARLP